MPSAVTVYYPFHPLADRRLKVIAWPRKPATAATVEHPDGSTIKIPVWMLESDAAHFALSKQTFLSLHALAALLDVVALDASARASTMSTEEVHGAAANDVPVRGRSAPRSRSSARSRAAATARRADDASHRGGAATRSTGRRL